MMRSWLLRPGLTVACSLLALPAFAQVPPPQPSPAPTQPPPTVQPPVGTQPTTGKTIQGRIVRTIAPNEFVIRQANNQEVTITTNPQTHFMHNRQAARWADVRAGENVTVVYTMHGDHWLANSVSWGAMPVPGQPPPVEGTLVQGTVVRVVAPDQVVLRTADGKEVIVYVSPQTTYLNNNQAAVFTDIRPGANIGVNYDERNRRFMARRIFWRRR